MNNRRRGFRPRQQKNNFRRRSGGSADHSGQIYNISTNRNFKRTNLNPAQLEKTISKYKQLAKDAQSSGDFILYENYLQHADHYSRKLFEINNKNISNLSTRDESNATKNTEGENPNDQGQKVLIDS